jgi:hypothetical protein
MAAVLIRRRRPAVVRSFVPRGAADLPLAL